MDAGETTAPHSHIPWEPKVDEPEGSTTPSAERTTQGPGCDEGTLDGGCGEDDVGFREHLAEVCQWDGLPVQASSELPCACEAPIQNPDASASMETLRGDAGHLPRPNEGNNRILEGHGGLDESDREVAHGRVFGTDTGDLADTGRNPNGTDEEIRERTSARGPGWSSRWGRSDLLRHLLLAFRDGIETARDAEEVGRSVLVLEDIEGGRVFGCDNPLDGLGREPGCRRQGVDLNSVARREEDEVRP